MGNAKALEVYIRLLGHTHTITKELDCDKYIFYADQITDMDIWENTIYRKKTQQGEDLGERMHNAFTNLFAEGHKSIQIIGSDCYELTADIIQSGFEKLTEKEVVIGPSTDGGYYLLGMRAPMKNVFTHKQWSTDAVFTDTVMDLQNHSISYAG